MREECVLESREQAQSDFIQDYVESETLEPHLLEMFGERGENAPPWDREGRYAVPSLAVYAPFKHHESNAQSYVRIQINQPLLPQLVRAQALGYEVPGVPTLQIAVRDSVYEKHFLLPKVITVT